MRALIVSLALAVVVVICMAVVVLLAAFTASAAMLVSIGLGMFMVASLFAAIAALGPKSRPTPFLTPTVAGTAAAVLMTVALIVGISHLGQAFYSTMSASEPATVEAPAPGIVTTAPQVPQATNEPEPIQFPNMTIVPAGPQHSPSVSQAESDIPIETPAQPAKTPSLDVTEPGAGNPDVNSNSGHLTPDSARQEPAAAPEPSASPAVPPVPIPPIPPPPTARLVLSDEPFDTSNPPPGPGQSSASSPPLPRSRPCGVDGQPCP